MEDIRNIVRKHLKEIFTSQDNPSPKATLNHSEMTLKQLKDELAKTEEKMSTASPQIHMDNVWSKGMRERINSLTKAIIEKAKSEEISEHYVDTEWSRQGLEPELIDPMTPVMYSQPHMQMVGSPMTGTPKLEENKGDRTIVFIKEFNKDFKVTIKVSRDGRISEIENERHVRFPYSKGQPYSRGLEAWACNNGYLMDGKNMCAEKKVFGIKVSDYPQGHPVRLLYPGKFR